MTPEVTSIQQLVRAVSVSVSIMASNVWVLYAAKPGDKTYIRGSEITSVRMRTGTSYSSGKEIESSTLQVSYAGSEYGSVDLWKFRSRSAAAEAVQELLAALAADPCGVVAKDKDGKVRVRPLPPVAE